MHMFVSMCRKSKRGVGYIYYAMHRTLIERTLGKWITNTYLHIAVDQIHGIEHVLRFINDCASDQ